VIAASDTQTLHDAIDVRDGKADSLADVGTFKDAMSRLPADSLVRGYANPGAIAQLVSLAQLSGQSNPATQQQAAGRHDSLKVDGLASFAMFANSGGYSTVFHVHIKDGADPGLYGSQSAANLTLRRWCRRTRSCTWPRRSTAPPSQRRFNQGPHRLRRGPAQPARAVHGHLVANDIAPISPASCCCTPLPAFPPADRCCSSRAIRCGRQRPAAHHGFVARSQPGLHIRDLPAGRERTVARACRRASRSPGSASRAV